MDASAPTGPLRAIFFNDVSACAAHQLCRWVGAGHQVAACVLSHRHHRSRWRRDRWRRIFAPTVSLGWVLRHHGIPLITAPRDLKNVDFVSLLARFDADVLISVAFPHRIPANVTAQFRCGGVNVHPALLPQYRGPHPVHVMAIDAALERFGGVTLHRIADGFDEGDIIAQLPLGEEDLARPEWHAVWFARLAADLIVEDIPKFCAGRLQATPQKKGNWRYARLMLEDLRMFQDMDVATLALRARVLGPLGKLHIYLGGKAYKIGGLSRVEPERTGQPPRMTWHTLEFDAADGRIWLKRENRIERRLRTIRNLQQLRRLSRVSVPTKSNRRRQF
jgi:methionyl-tRNA formyltransferase